MDIGVYSHYFVPEIGAPSSRIYDLARAWRSTGHRPHIVTCFPNHPQGVIYEGYTMRSYMHETLDGLDVHRSWSYMAANVGFLKRTLGHLTFMFSSWACSGRHVPALDIVIGTSPTLFAAVAAAGTAARRRVPFVMDVRDLWPAVFVELGVLRNRQLIWLLERLELALYHQATRIVTVTDAFRDALIERGICCEKIVTIPNGADVSYWTPEPRPAALESAMELAGKFVVLYIGTHGIAHRLEQVLEAAHLLRNHEDIAFVFVGEGAEKSALVKLAGDMALTNVRFFDAVPKAQVKELYALSDVCLVPLRNGAVLETFLPSKMFEILAMGRPIIGSVRGEAARVLQQSGGAIVVQPEDASALARAIKELTDNRDRGHQLGETGRKFVALHYSREALARRYINALEDAIREYGRASLS